MPALLRPGAPSRAESRIVTILAKKQKRIFHLSKIICRRARLLPNAAAKILPPHYPLFAGGHFNRIQANPGKNLPLSAGAL